MNSIKRPHSAQRLIVMLVAVLVLLISVAWLGGAFTDKIEPGVVSTPALAESDVYRVSATPVPVVEPVPASLTAKQNTLISPRILARITAINVRSGDTVSAGQLLAQLEQTDLQARAKQVSEQVRAIQARLKEAEQNLERMTKLHRDGMVAKADLDRAQANQQALAADLSGAKLALEDAQTSVTYTEIRAPIAGRVIDRFAEPGDTATPGKPLLSLYNPMSLQVEAQVRETLAIKLKIGDPVTVEIPTLNKSLAAFVEEIVPAADPNSRSFAVKARFDFDASLLPGMYARLLLPIGTEQKLLIPQSRIAKVGQLDVVWLRKGDQVERRFIKLGDWHDATQVEVVSGLAEGDEVLPVSVDGQ